MHGGGPKRGNPAMTTKSLTAERKGDPQDVEGKNDENNIKIILNCYKNNIKII